MTVELWHWHSWTRYSCHNGCVHSLCLWNCLNSTLWGYAVSSHWTYTNGAGKRYWPINFINILTLIFYQIFLIDACTWQNDGTCLKNRDNSRSLWKVLHMTKKSSHVVPLDVADQTLLIFSKCMSVLNSTFAWKKTIMQFLLSRK